MRSAPSKVSTRTTHSTIYATPTPHASPASTNSSASRPRPTPLPNRPAYRAAIVPRPPPELSALKAFIVVHRQTRKILAEFETREEAEAFRDGLISTHATGKSPLSIRSTLGDRNDQEAGAAHRAEKREHTAHPLRGTQRRGPRRPGS